MTELTQKEMLRSLLSKVDRMGIKQEKMKIKQDNMDATLSNIEIELGGTSIEPGRGIVPRLIQAEICIGEIKKKQYKIFTWAIALAIGINVLWAGIKTIVTLIKG